MSKKNSYLTATDQFCGAGGTTVGVKAAGVEVKMALNHWQMAIDTHQTNNPEVSHDCTDIQACDPRRYPSTDFLFASPECTNHSLAKGKKRKNQDQYEIFDNGNTPTAEEERSRATMWDVVRFAEYHKYNVIVVENVVDARRWALWKPWLLAMHALGYQHEAKYLNSVHFHPCPQSRDRMYVVFWRAGNKKPDLEYRPVAPCPKCGDQESYQSWKNPQKKWGKYKQQYVYRCSSCTDIVEPYYYAAFNVIDWQVPITRIGDRKRPLAKNTIRRIQHGLDKYGGQQMIITGRYTSGIGNRVRHAATQPLPTQPGDASHFLLSCIHTSRSGYGGRSREVTLPLTTQTTLQDAEVIIPPSIIELRGTSNSKSSVDRLGAITAGGINHGVLFLRNKFNNVPRTAAQPMDTQVTAIQHGLLIGNYTPGWTRSLNNPIGTMTTIPTQQAILTHENWSSFLSYYYGTQTDSRMTDPLNTVTTVDRAAVTAFGAPNIEDCYYRCLKAHEVQRAMAFDDTYNILGNSRQKVKQLGNAVTPPVMSWITKQIVASLAR